MVVREFQGWKLNDQYFGNINPGERGDHGGGELLWPSMKPKDLRMFIFGFLDF